MKKIGFLILSFLYSLSGYAQPNTFIKFLTNNNKGNFTQEIKEGINNHFYMELENADSIVNYRNIVELDEHGNRFDSVSVVTIMGLQNYSTSGIDKLQNNFLYYSILNDNSRHYLYTRLFDTQLQTIKEKIVDTLLINEFIIWHIVNRKNHHVFLTGVYANNWFDYNIYETDSNFNLLKKVNTGFSDGGPGSDVLMVSLVEIPVDSSYIFTSYNWYLKFDANFNIVDTISSRDYPSIVDFGNTKKYNDSIYFQNVFHIKNTGPPNFYFYSGMLKRTRNAVILDTIVMVTPNYSNEVNQFRDFISFIDSDTLFYCGPVSQESSSVNKILISKLDANGYVFWQKIFDLDVNVWHGTIEATHDGGCIGQWVYNNGMGGYSLNVLLIKTDKYGNTPVGIDENITVSDKQILVYPNPAVSLLHFQTGLYDKLQLQIYNMDGKLQNEKILLQGDNPVDISNYAKGIYCYRIIYKDKFLESGKFIKE
ncbi:MAG: T9SS type A sorting domain-containing protein [Bacteroidota bacterium]